MELPALVIGANVVEEEIFFFTGQCPVGVSDHPHVLIRHKEKYLFLNTCSSSLDTAIRLAEIRNWPKDSYPIVCKNAVNKLSYDSYVNCNEYIELTEEQFGEYYKAGYIYREKGGGVMEDADMRRILHGIEISLNITDEDKSKILD